METIFASLINNHISPPEMFTIDLSNTIISPEICERIPKKKIRHLVLSGGGCWGVYMFGILLEALKYKFIEKECLQTIHSTSVGSILAVFISLDFEEGVLHDYIVKRPWKGVFKRKQNTLFEMYSKYGVLTIPTFEQIFEPLFLAADLSIDVTLQELYDHTGVEIHMYATELNTYKSVDLSYKTHPDWRVCDACYASSSIPIIFSPIITDKECLIDGCFLSNYPIGYFKEQFKSEIESESLNMNEVFGITVVESTNNDCDALHIYSNIIVTIEYFIFFIFYKIFEYLCSFQSNHSIPYEIKIVKCFSFVSFSYNAISYSNYRENIIESGRQSFRENVLKWWGGEPTDLADSTPVECPTG